MEIILFHLLLTLLQFVQWVSEVFIAMKLVACEGN